MTRPWRVFAIAASGSSLPVLDATKLYVTAPSIQVGLGIDPSVIEYAIGGYILAFGLTLIPAGRYGDLRSRRRTMLIGLAIFILASAMAGLAANGEMLVISRVVQGIGGGIVIPQSIGFIQALFSGGDRARAFGLLGAVFGVATAVAPTVGGLLVALGGHEWGWRISFLMNVPFGLAVLAIAWRRLPDIRSEIDQPLRLYLDGLGTLLLAIATASLLVPLVAFSASGGPQAWPLLPLAVASAIAFVLWERRVTRKGGVPLVDLELFGVRSFRIGVLVAFLNYSALPSLMFLSSLYVQAALAADAFEAGVLLIPFSVAFAIASWMAGRVVGSRSRFLVLTGLCVTLGGAIAVAGAVASGVWPPVSLAVAMIPAGIGGGLVAAANQARAMAEVPQDRGGLAGSIQQLAQRLGTALGVTIVASTFHRFVHDFGVDGAQGGLLAGAAIVAVALAAGIGLAIVDLRGR